MTPLSHRFLNRPIAMAALLVLVCFSRCAAADEAPPRFQIDTDRVLLRGVPTDEVTITALTKEGRIDEGFSEAVSVRGVELTEWDIATGRDVAQPLPKFRNGRLRIATDLAIGRKVFVTADRIVVEKGGPRQTVQEVYRVWAGWSLLPPVLAVVLAVLLRNVLIALLAAVWSGTAILYRGDIFTAALRTVDEVILGQLTGEDGRDHLMILLFTLFLGAMVGVMTHSGGTTALVHSLTRFTRRREHVQGLTWLLGLLVFFDDYANTLLVGSTMRPITDRYRISREKLAFLVDATAAPVSGLAIISTWVGVEIGYIADSYSDLGLGSDVYAVFLTTILYRFYPVYLLAFVAMIAWTGRDFGSMSTAERRALTGKSSDETEDSSEPASVPNEANSTARRQFLHDALIPLIALLVLIVIGLGVTGYANLSDTNQQLIADEQEPIAVTFWSVLDNSESTRVMFLASFAASLVAMVTALASRTLTLSAAADAWISGMKSMMFALVILVLAWAVAMLCNAENLNTAGYLVEISRGELPVTWMPLLAFLLAAVVSFATGSSWSTMGLLMPLFIAVTHYLLVDIGQEGPSHHVMLGTIGAVLAGAIFGDHCSPISDTTVLSSAATSCDHLRHVWTQMPYAVVVAVVSILFGYLPAGFGVSPWILLPVGLAVLFIIVRFIGRPTTVT